MVIHTVDRSEFRESLLSVMERKRHWAWPHFQAGEVSKEKLRIHLAQEYATYVRDFPIFLGRAYIQCDIPEVRRALAENLYEEETGGLSAKRPHAELFMEIPRGLGYDLDAFTSVELLPASIDYRRCLDQGTASRGWDVAVAVSTLFLEGTAYERGELDPQAQKRPEAPLEKHPLVLHYQLPIESLALTKVHRQVEGGHRQAAWQMILEHVEPSQRPRVVEAMEVTLDHWLGYRDGVALACGLERPKLAVAESSRSLAATG